MLRNRYSLPAPAGHPSFGLSDFLNAAPKIVRKNAADLTPAERERYGFAADWKPALPEVHES